MAAIPAVPVSPTSKRNDRQLREITGESLAALRAFNIPPSIFARAGKPACIHKEENGRHIITEATDRILRNRLTRAADFYEITAEGFTNCSPPMDMVKDILAHAAHGVGLPGAPGNHRSTGIA